MELSIMPNDYLIMGSDFTVDRFYSDFMLRALKFKNTSTKPIEIRELLFSVKINGTALKSYSYTSESLKYWIPKWNKKTYFKDPNMLMAHAGAKKIWDYSKLASSYTLNPDEEIGLRNEYFHIMCEDIPDELEVTVKFSEEGQLFEKSTSIPLVNYKNKNNYIFPLKGTWQINGNFDCLYKFTHRSRISEEFALDATSLDSNNMCLDGIPQEDYHFYGAPLHAAADGVVVHAFDSMDENTRNISHEEWLSIQEKHGYWAPITGNTITIKHANGEYTKIHHMVKGSIAVSIGDQVTQGQVIGKLGNTGFSGCPHLHFELCAGPEEDSKSFPCCFTNITNCAGEKIGIVSEEYTIINSIYD